MSGLLGGMIKYPVSKVMLSRELPTSFLSMVPAETRRSKSIPTKSQPVGLASTSSAVYVPTASGLEIHPTGGPSSVHSGSVTAVAAHDGGNEDVVAFGSGQKVTIATVNGTSLKVLVEIADNRGDVLALAFSKDGALLAAGDVSYDRC